jgi:hypothetical protein
MKKILIASPIQVFPPLSGGQIRTASLCEAFAANGWNVTVFAFTGRKIDYLHLRKSYAQSFGQHLNEYIYLNPFFGFLQFCTYFCGWPPLWLTVVSFFFRPRQLEKLLKEHNFLLVDFPYAFPLASDFKGTRWLNTHNVEFHLWKRSRFFSNLIQRLEINCLDKFHWIFCCTDEDKNFFVRNNSGIKHKTSVLRHNYGGAKNLPPLGDQFDVRAKLGIAQDQIIIIFVGSAFYPNEEAVNFLENFFESNNDLLMKMKISFFIVGSVCALNLTKPGFFKFGTVNNLGPFLNASNFAINPVVRGSGANIKMLDYVFAGLPVITTEFGLRGFPLKDGQECFVFQRNRLMSILAEVISLSAQALDGIRLASQMRLKNDFDMGMNLRAFLEGQWGINENFD